MLNLMGNPVIKMIKDYRKNYTVKIVSGKNQFLKTLMHLKRFFANIYLESSHVS